MVDKRGFTLIEVLAVFVILVILISVAVPVITSIIKNMKMDVCRSNSLELERKYDEYLNMEGIFHTEVRFLEYKEQFFEEVCPSGGEITFRDGRVICSVHGEGDGSDEVGDNGVPFL